jgi:hypothetical protein
MVGQGQQRVLGHVPDVVQPLGGHAVGQQFLVAVAGEQRLQHRDGWRCEWQFRLHIHGNEHLLHRLADFDPLRGAGPWVRLQLAPFRPVIGPVVVVDVAEQEARIALVHDQANVAADPHRPEIPVPRLVQPVQAHAGVGRVELQVEGRGLGRSLLVAGQARQAIGEGVGDAEFHHDSPVVVDRPTVELPRSASSRKCILARGDLEFIAWHGAGNARRRRHSTVRGCSSNLRARRLIL